MMPSIHYSLAIGFESNLLTSNRCISIWYAHQLEQPVCLLFTLTYALDPKAQRGGGSWYWLARPAN